MKNSALYIIVLTILSLPVTVMAQLATLKVLISGIESPTGKVEVSLFNSEETYMKKPFLQQTVDATDSGAEVEFAGLLDGDYAVVVVHDENDNGLLDTGFLGFGGEAYGFSNNPFSLFGRPSFDAARIEVGTANLEVDVSVD